MLDTLNAFQFQVGISPCSSLNFIAMLNGCLPTSVTFKYLGHKNSVIDLRSQFTYNSITPIKTLGRFSVTSLWSSQRPRGPAWVLHRARLRAPARVSGSAGPSAVPRPGARALGAAAPDPASPSLSGFRTARWASWSPPRPHDGAPATAAPRLRAGPRGTPHRASARWAGQHPTVLPGRLYVVR